jgi:hypothetical protein
MVELNIGSVFNGAFIQQINYQVAQNVATNSPGAVQSLTQTASNSATVWQQG